MTGPSLTSSTHPRAEHSGLHRDARSRSAWQNALVERLGELGGAALVKLGRVALLRAIRDERELADDERRAADVEQRAVETPGLVLEDPQPRDLAGEPFGACAVVIARDAEENADAWPIAPPGVALALETRWTTALTRRRGCELRSGASPASATGRACSAPALPCLAAELVQAAAERVVRVVVHRRDLEHGAELRLRILPAAEAEVRDAERLSDRRFPRLGSASLLERDGRLRRAARSAAASILPDSPRTPDSHQEPLDLVEDRARRSRTSVPFAIACSRRSAETITTSLSGASNPMSSRDTSLKTTRSTAFATSFARARSSPAAPLSAAKPTSSWPFARRRPSSASTSSVGSSSSVHPSVRPSIACPRSDSEGR